MSSVFDTKHSSLYYEAKEVTVTELSAKIKNTIEVTFDHVKVRGEISGLKFASSGHCYFNLKDSNAVIAVICWKGVASSLEVKIQDGVEVVITGKITTYPGMSRYQINVLKIELSGIGSLMQLLEKRRQQFLKEGLFDESRKKPLPFFPARIGIVTSITGAVIRDMLHRIKDRCPTHVIIWPVLVQGDNAASEISNAIDGFNKYENLKPDIIIVARGGGSIEDLWAFNEEIVVRAVANSYIPVISAVGHETDYTLIDFVSDKRAPTPTAAAEFSVPVIKNIKLDIDNLYKKIKNLPVSYINHQRNLLIAYSKFYEKLPDIINRKQQIIDDIELYMKRAWPSIIQRREMQLSKYNFSPALLQRMIEIKQHKLDEAYKTLKLNVTHLISLYSNATDRYFSKLSSIDYHKVVKQGFAVIRDNKGKVILNKEHTKADDHISIELRDGKINAIVK
jgi:exodeoxyribonuclease VII large subunit